MKATAARLVILLPAAALLAAACGSEAPPAGPSEVSLIPTPAAAGSAVPHLAVWNGRPLLSWIDETQAGLPALRLAVLDEAGWSAPKTIAADADLLVNWADFPSLVALDRGGLAAQWLERRPGAGFAYGIRFSTSPDGTRWAPPRTPHPAEPAAEYGFVSLVPDADGAVDLLWLDGRHTVDPGGRMLLVHRRWDGSRLGPETVLDDDVCTCCQTSAARVGDGLVVAYRDRDPTDVRDISTVRLEGGVWSAPRTLHADGWRIGGCPVNGPALAAAGQRLAVAWFTAAADEPRVLLAFSEDAGQRFSAPSRLDDGSPLGRVDLVLDDDGSALVSWLERVGEEGAEVRVRRVGSDGAPGRQWTVGRTAAARASGFPRVARVGGRLYVAWTDPGDGLRLARLDPS